MARGSSSAPDAAASTQHPHPAALPPLRLDQNLNPSAARHQGHHCRVLGWADSGRPFQHMTPVPSTPSTAQPLLHGPRAAGPQAARWAQHAGMCQENLGPLARAPASWIALGEVRERSSTMACLATLSSAAVRPAARLTAQRRPIAPIVGRPSLAAPLQRAAARPCVPQLPARAVDVRAQAAATPPATPAPQGEPHSACRGA